MTNRQQTPLDSGERISYLMTRPHQRQNAQEGPENFSAPAFISKLQSALSKSHPKTLQPLELRNAADRFSAVAVILRLVPNTQRAMREATEPDVPAGLDDSRRGSPLRFHSPTDKFASVEEFLAQPWVRFASVELLFIKRAVNPSDRWSGDVAFPGGRAATGETVRGTVFRETMEEIGLDLSEGSGFLFLGSLGSASTGFTRTHLTVTPCVFLQTMISTPPLRLESSEVAGARWVPLEYFYQARSSLPSHLKRYNWRDLDRAANLGIVRTLGEWAGVEAVWYTMFALPFNAAAMEQGHDTDDAAIEFLLWGLTSRLTADVLCAGGMVAAAAAVSMRSTTFVLFGDILLRSLAYRREIKRGTAFGLSMLLLWLQQDNLACLLGSPAARL